MEHRNILWALTRTTGLWLLIYAIQLLPTLLNHGHLGHSAGMIAEVSAYLVAGLYFYGRGEWLISLLEQPAHSVKDAAPVPGE